MSLQLPRNKRTRRDFPRRLDVVTWAILLLATIIGFQNCTGFKADVEALADNLQFASSGGDELQPATDRVDPACMSKRYYDACLFKKNPVAQQGQPLTEGASVEPLQTYGVKLTGLAGTGLLENATFKIDTVRGTPVSTQTTTLRYSAQNDSGHKFLQVMTYYWLNRTAEFLFVRTGTLPAKGKGIRVAVDDTIAGWSPRTNSIHLKLADNGNAMAWNADLAIHYFGLANLHHATNGAIANLSTGGQAKHKDCGLSGNGCCVSAVGCSRALASGVGDYFVAMMFPDKTGVGETWSNRADGLAHCGLSRSLAASAARTPQTAFQACNGDVSAMGTVYASIWWEARKQAQTQSSSGAKDIDTIFMQHLSLLDGSDDFSTVLAKIRSVDQRLFNNRYTPLFNSQFQARGL